MLVVTALSSNTSLGGAVTAAAAARAGLCRPTKLEGLAVTERDGPVPVIGHAVPTVRGFQGVARLLSLALPALQALIDDATLPSDEDVGLFLALPSLPLPEVTAEVDPEVEPEPRPKQAPPPAPADVQATRLVDRLVGLSGLRVAANLRRTFAFGHASFGLATQAALTAVARREVKVCVLGAVDSLCDPRALGALLAQDRLKTEDNPDGLQPGEASIFLVVTTGEEALRRRTSGLARITGAGVAREPRPPKDPVLGEGMMLAIENLIEGTGPLAKGRTFFVVDCNGESRRAVDWGSCQQRLTAAMPGVLDVPEWFPAINFGDTGAASAGLAAQMVIRSFARRHAPRPCAVVLSSSDDGGRSAIRIEQEG